MKTAHQILIEAASLIETRGHAKGLYEDARGCVCAYGAIQASCFDNPCLIIDIINNGESSYASAVIAAQEEVLAMSGSRDVAHWNDAPERTGDEVAAMLRRAAERVR